MYPLTPIAFADKKVGDTLTADELNQLRDLMEQVRLLLENRPDFDVRRFVSGLGTTVTQSALRSAIDAMPTSGGMLRCPAGVTYLPTDIVELNKMVKIVGDGGEDVYRQYSNTLFQIGDGFNVFNITYPGCTIEGIGFKQIASDATAGAGIDVNILKKHPLYGTDVFPIGVGSNFNLQNCTFTGFYRGVNMRNAFEWRITNVRVNDFSNAGIVVASEQLPDAGDWSLGGNVQIQSQKYDSRSPIGLLITSSNGGRLNDIKFNGGHSDCIKIAPDYSKTQSTSDKVLKVSGIHLFSNISAENHKGYVLNAKDTDCLVVDGPMELAPYQAAPGFFNFDNCKEIAFGGSLRTRRTNGFGTKLNIPYIANFNNNCTGTILGVPIEEFNNDTTVAFVNVGTMTLQGYGSGAGGGTTPPAYPTGQGQYFNNEGTSYDSSKWTSDSSSNYAGGTLLFATDTSVVMNGKFGLTQSGYFDLWNIAQSSCRNGVLTITNSAGTVVVNAAPVTLQSSASSSTSASRYTSPLLQADTYTFIWASQSGDTHYLLPYDGFALRNA